MAKVISERQRLEAFAYYTMAAARYAEAREFERGAARILGATEGGLNDFISDGIYGEDAGKALPFDTVLDRAGVKVKVAKKSKQR